MSEKIALIGATGAIGRSIGNALRSERRPYRVIGRSRSALEREFGDDPLAEIVPWNPIDPPSVRAALNGVDAAVYLVGVPYWDFRMHPILMQTTVDAARAKGVKRLLLVGTVYPYGRPRAARVDESHAREPHTFKGRMRRAQEDIALAAHARGDLLATILRLPDFYGPGVDKSFLHAAFQSALDGKRAAVVGPLDTPHEFAFTPDVGPVVTALLDEPRAFGRAWNLGGFAVTSQREMIERAAAVTGHRPNLFVANGLMLRALAPFDKMLRELVEMQYLQTSPVIMNDDALRALLPGLRKTSYDEGVRRTLAAMGPASFGSPSALPFAGSPA